MGRSAVPSGDALGGEDLEARELELFLLDRIKSTLSSFAGIPRTYSDRAVLFGVGPFVPVLLEHRSAAGLAALRARSFVVGG